jgi:3D (Asp-Asp-Asp) domain-containing protein
MMNLKTGIFAQSRSAQSAIMVGGYLAAASLVVWSASSAKRTVGVPALAAVESAPIAAHADSAQAQHQVIDPMLTGDRPQASFETLPASYSVEAGEPVNDEIRYFNGRAVRPVKTLWMTVTGYSPDERSCGEWADGVTASNKSVWTNAMQLVAADTRILPFGSLLTIEGYANDQIVPVEDRGGAIKGMRLDLLYPTHEEALQWGIKRMPITVWEYVED